MTDRCDPHLQIEVEVHEQRYGQNYGDARLVRLMLCEQHREAFDQRTRNVRNDGLFLPLQKQRMISAMQQTTSGHVPFLRLQHWP